jgi:hypothetical protein
MPPTLHQNLMPLLSQACLEGNGSGRHHYVRKNAALACYYIHRNFGETLLPDGPELIYRLVC